MRYRIVVLLLFAIPLFLNAQIISSYGLKVGVVSSKAVDLSSKGYYWMLYQDSRISGSFSLFTQLLTSEYTRFEIELGYKQEGAEDKVSVTTVENPDGSGDKITVDHAYDFLSLNLSFQPKIETDDICLYGIISPSINYILKNRDQIILDKDIKNIVLGYNIGLGFQPKNIMNGKLFFEIKFGSSFSKYLKSEYLEAKFNTLQFNIGSYIN